MTATKASRMPHCAESSAPVIGSCAMGLIHGCEGVGRGGLTTSTEADLRVAKTRTRMPELKTMVEAIFLYVLREDRHSMGMGIRIR